MMLIKLFLFFLLLLILPDMYIYKAYIRRVSKKWTHWAYWLPSLFLLLGMTLVFSIHEPRPDSMQRLSNFLLIFLCFSVPKALFVIVILFMKLLYIISGKKLYGGYVAGGLALASLIYVIYGATEGKQHFQIREVTISSDELPSGFDGYRIVQISDIHSGSWTGNGAALQKAVNLINAQHADLVLFTGDLVNNVATELDEFIPILEQIKGKDGVYSVLGNHDYSPYIKWETEEAQEANLNSLKSKQAAMGWKILNNDHVILHHHGDSIALAGVENSGNPPFPNYGDLQKALKGTEGMYKILMSHDPTHWHREVLPESDVQLMLSGHTHEMQFSLFGFSPAKFVYPEHNGLYQEGKQSLFVNIGLGYLMFPMRLGAWPEITVITLHKI
ncbi:metallophosphoesterase [Phocaeicola vulgatus]|uniref:metallophosphoesterase n=1 Tax=Phocaeicola vulgatus TaxID=821 RepID=UPI0039B6D392